MRQTVRATLQDTFSVAEIAAAAGVPAARVEHAIRVNGIPTDGRLVGGRQAVALVRSLRHGVATIAGQALPLNVLPEPRRKRAAPLAASAIAHVLFLLTMLGAASLGLLKAADTEEQIPPKSSVHLVYLMSPGPGGGGGGGGLKMPAPPPKAEKKAPVKRKVSSPVPPPAKRPAPPPPVPPRPTPVPPPPVPRPVETPKPAPPPPPAPPAPQAVVAPVASLAADDSDRAGLPNDSPSQRDSSGPGSGGGVGSGHGAGLGEGSGGGIGPGEGGGTGGGPYRPGAGITPPQLLREVRANYTEDARRRGIEGDVDLEIVIRRDGTVGSVRILQALGAGLDQKAVDAVKQWKFSPATRYGTAVDIVVDVSVGFKLR